MNAIADRLESLAGTGTHALAEIYREAAGEIRRLALAEQHALSVARAQQEQIKRLADAGRPMANLMFNWKQQARFNRGDIELMEKLQRDWDAARKGEGE